MEMQLISSMQNSSGWQEMDLSIRYGREVLFLSEICPMDNLWMHGFSSEDEAIRRMVCTNGFTDFSKAIRHTLYKRNSCCPMDSHTDSPAESPKPYRNRNRYLYILYLLCSLSYGCPMDTFLLSFWSSPNYSVKIKIFLLTWCKVVLSYARKKSKGGTWHEHYSKRTDRRAVD